MAKWSINTNIHEFSSDPNLNKFAAWRVFHDIPEQTVDRIH